jgi:hypothetical protein
MTYQDYADVLLVLQTRPNDSRLLTEVIIELGFSKEVAERISISSSMTTEDIEIIEICNLSRIQKNGAKVLLVIGGATEKRGISSDGDVLTVVKKGSGSVTTGWRISQQYSVLPVFSSDAFLILKPTVLFTTSVLLTEVDEFYPPPGWPPMPPPFTLLPKGSKSLHPHALVAPSDLDEAVAQAKQKF